MSELITASIAYSVTMLILWLLTRKDEKLAENWKKPLGVFIRMAALFFMLHLLLHSLPFETWSSYTFIAIFFGLSFLYLCFASNLLIVILAWGVYQWAFWFPVKDEIILKSEIKELGK